MGNLNKVMLIGRLTREPEVTEFKNGGKVANLGFAVHNRRKNAAGEWEETPVWLNMKAYNREHGRKLADLAALLHKGRQVYVEGHLALEQWTGKEDGKHHSKTLVYVDAIEFLGGGKPGEGPGGAEGGVAAGPADHLPGEHVADAGWPEELPEEPAEPAPKPAKGGRKK